MSLLRRALVPAALLAAVLGLASCGTAPSAASVDGVAVPKASLDANLEALTNPATSQVALCVAAAVDSALQNVSSVTGASPSTVDTAVADSELDVLITDAYGRHLLAQRHSTVLEGDVANARSDLSSQLGSACPGGGPGGPLSDPALPTGFVDNVVGVIATEERLIATYGNLDLSSTGLQTYYAAHPEAFRQQCVAIVAVPTQAQAQAVHDAVAAGATLSQAAAQNNVDLTTPGSSTQPTCYSNEQLQGDPNLSGLAQQLVQLGGVGKVSQPIEAPSSTGSGQDWVLIQLTSQPLEPFNPNAVRGVMLSSEVQVLSTVLDNGLVHAQVSVDPRYGVWKHTAGLEPPDSPPARFVLDPSANLPAPAAFASAAPGATPGS